MAFFNWFSNSKDKTQNEFDAGVLGVLEWSEDDEAWHGSFNGTKFFVSFNQSKDNQLKDVLNYAETVLMSIDWLNDAVEAEKKKYLNVYPKFAGELQGLKIESLCFSIHEKQGRYLNCQLGYGASDRFWSLDFHDRKCSGIGFDA